MPGKSKIEKYGFEARVEALAFNQGKTVEEIAEILTAALKGQDVITKSSVARYLQPRRDQLRGEIQERLNQHAKEKLETDLECIEEIQLFLMNEMRNEYREDMIDGKKVVSGHSVKDRSEYAIKAARVIDMKLARSLGDPHGGGSGLDPVDLDKFRSEADELKAEALKEESIH